MHINENFWWKAKALVVVVGGGGGLWMTTSMWKYIMLPYLVALIEYNTQVSEVFKNFITF